MKINKSNHLEVNIIFHSRLRVGFILLFCTVFHLKNFSQDSLLTFNEAIGIALNNNYDIQIAGNKAFQEGNNNTTGNAGMLPAIDANGSYLKSSNSLDQKYNNGNEIKRNASEAINSSGNLTATWTVFDGLKMFITKEKLSELSLQAQQQLKIQIENSMVEITDAYYSMVRQQQLLRSMQEEIRFSEEREKIADRKLKNGSGSRLELLQVKTDLNRQRVAEIKIKSDADEAHINLNRLLRKPLDTKFQVEDTVIISFTKQLDEIRKNILESNTELNLYKRSQRIAELTLREKNAQRLPIISLNAQYAFTKNTSEAGFLLYSKTNGFNYGATATLPLFHGFNISRQIKNSKLDILNAGLAYESATSQVNAELENSWRNFNNAVEVLKIEEQNIVFAKEVLGVAQERYKVGLSNNTEMLDAQRTYEEAMTRLAEARYTAKISETKLKKVNGDLIVFSKAVMK